MGTFSRSAALASILAVCSIPHSLAQDSKKEPSGSVSGRLTVGGKPASGVAVMCRPADRPQFARPAVKATTDEQGRFTLKSVRPGNYTIMPHTPALVVGTDVAFGQVGQPVILGDGEEVDGIDFALVKGGVITGRVTDADGRPLIEQSVNLIRLGDNLIRLGDRGQPMPIPNFNPFMFRTDDRGVYRIFGLSPGHYKVSVGEAADNGSFRIGLGGAYPRTFHPDVSDESRAPAVEVGAGSEATGVDIKVGRPSRTYAATGRIIDADTGRPLANLLYGHGPVVGDQSMGGFGWTNNRTNSNGEFRIDGLISGRYAAFAVATEQVDFYSEPAVFEITDSDVRAIEIKTRRGSSISGTAVIEGTDDPDMLARLSKLELRAFVLTDGLAAPSMAPIRVNPDGSFLITGLRPGKARITFNGFASEAGRGLSLLRVEREGVSLRDGVDIAAGENVSGVRVVLAYGTCVVRGQVKVEGGELGPNTRLTVVAGSLEPDGMRRSAITDARGRFRIEGLLQGEYEITVYSTIVTPSAPGVPPPPYRQSNQTLAKQNVTVVNGVETEVTIAVDLGAKDKDNE
jgi:protocatechuate 3,4-dioxygenase beta subunit